MKENGGLLVLLSVMFLGALFINSCTHLAVSPTEMSSRGVVRKGDVEVIEAPWGTLQWLVSGDRGMSEKMTLGRVTFKPGQANPPHLHPSCEEILFVVAGTLEHSLPSGETVVLRPGDCIVLPQGMKHNAKNVGDGEAVVVVCYSSAYRKVVGE